MKQALDHSGSLSGLAVELLDALCRFIRERAEQQELGLPHDDRQGVVHLVSHVRRKLADR
jgi:hypothetical protein